MKRNKVFIRSRKVSRGDDGLGRPYFFVGADGSVNLNVCKVNLIPTSREFTPQSRELLSELVWFEIDLEDGTVALMDLSTRKLLSASPEGEVAVVAPSAETIGDSEKWTKENSGVRSPVGGDAGGEFHYFGLRSSHGKYLSCKEENGSLIVVADQSELNSDGHWIISSNPITFLFKKTAIADSVVPEAIRNHHSGLRCKVFNGNDNLTTYTTSFKELVKEYDRSFQDGLEWNVFYEKLKVMHGKGDVFLQFPKDVSLEGWKNIDSTPECMDQFEEECDLNMFDDALPFIMAEYEHRNVLPIIGKNYNFNTYRKLAISIAMRPPGAPIWSDPDIPKDMIYAMVTFFLQFFVILLVLYSFFEDFGVNFGEKNWTEYFALFALVVYMVVYFVSVEWKQLKMTGDLIGWEWTNIGLLLDFFINLFLYIVVIFVQIGIMLDAENEYDMIANSVALLFITGIDDELSNLTDEQEKDATISLMAKRIFKSYEKRKKDASANHTSPRENPDLSEISSYIIPFNEWEGSNPVLFGYNGRWRENNWEVGVLKDLKNRRVEAMKVQHSGTRNPEFSGPGRKFYEGLEGLDERRYEGSFMIVKIDGEDTVYLVSDFTEEHPKFNDISSDKMHDPDRFWVTELKNAEEIVLLRSTSDGRFRGGVFLVKDFK